MGATTVTQSHAESRGFGPISLTCVLPLMESTALMYYVFHIDRSRIKFAAISANPNRCLQGLSPPPLLPPLLPRLP